MKMKMKMKETYLSRDFRETAARCFSTQAKELNAAFDMCLNAQVICRYGEKEGHMKKTIQRLRCMRKSTPKEIRSLEHET